MKIIEDASERVRCDHCDAVIEIELSDIMYDIGNGKMNWLPYSYYVTCPSCRQYINCFEAYGRLDCGE